MSELIQAEPRYFAADFSDEASDDITYCVFDRYVAGFQVGNEYPSYETAQEAALFLNRTAEALG